MRGSASGHSGRAAQSSKPLSGSNTRSEGLSQRDRNGRIQQAPMEPQTWEGAERSSDTSDGSNPKHPLPPRRERGVEYAQSGEREASGFDPRSSTLRPWRGPGWLDPETCRSVAEAGATRGFWAGCDWWYGRDGKYRSIEPGLFPLASRIPRRVGKLRGYGNAVCVPAAEAFIRAYISL